MFLAVRRTRNVGISRLKLSMSKMQSTVHNNTITSKITSTPSTPPFLARAAIVGASVGLASPLFAVGGVGAMWFSYLPKTLAGQIMKYAVVFVIGGGFTTALVTWVVPFLANNSDFILPFAATNAVAASFWYTLGEIIYGSAVMTNRMSVATVEKNLPFNFLKSMIARFGSLGVPVAGPVIGALTALTAPFLWPLCLRYLWSKDTQDLLLGDAEGGDTWLSHAYEWILLPVGLPVGILSGFAMHFMLHNSIAGVAGKPWTRTSLPVLVGLLGSSAVYFTFFRSDPNDLVWYTRTDPLTDVERSYNPRTGEYLNDNGRKGRIMGFRRGVMLSVTKLLRDPLQAVKLNDYFDKGTAVTREQVKRPYVPTKGDDFSVHDVKNDRKLHKIIDALVRQKHQQLQGLPVTPSSSSSLKKESASDDDGFTFKWNNKFSKDVKQELDISLEDFPQIARELEILIVESRKALQQQDVGTDNNNSAAAAGGGAVSEKNHQQHTVRKQTNRSVIQNTLPKTILAKHTANNHDEDPLLLLVDNLKLLEEEYLLRLGCVITEQKGQELLKEHQKEVFWKNTYYYVTLTGALVALGAAAAAVLRSKN